MNQSQLKVESDESLELVRLENATLFPCIKHPEISRRFMGGIQCAEGSILSDGLLSRQAGQIVYPAEPAYYKDSNRQGCGVECIFGGYVFDHFGHFILESLSRVWALLDNPSFPIIWFPVGPKNEFNAWQLQIIDLLGLSDREHIFCRDKVSGVDVRVPHVGYRIQNYFHVKHAGALAQIECDNVVAGKYIWLSRSKQKGRGGWDNENEIESMLRNIGWEIYYPEEHSIKEQIAEISSSDRVAGSEGSAFHAVMLCNDLKARLDIFSRGIKFSSNYQTIARTKCLEQYLHVPELEKVIAKGAGSVFRVTNPESIISFLAGDGPDPIVNTPTKLQCK